MIQIKRWLVRAAIVMSAMALVSCATPTHMPNKNTTKNISIWNAQKIVKTDLPRVVSVWGRGISGAGEPVISSTQLTSSGVEMIRNDAQRVVIPFKDLNISAYQDLKMIDIMDNSSRSTSSFEIVLMDVPPDKINEIADALLVLTRSGPKLRAMEEVELHFDATVKAYREASPKPTLPEEARRFKVQAENAVNNKQFEDAADYYEQAIEIAPWWPESHFNRALVLGETKEYQQAIIEMKRYLLLVPNAPDARAVQDKIYVWEGEDKSEQINEENLAPVFEPHKDLKKQKKEMAH